MSGSLSDLQTGVLAALVTTILFSFSAIAGNRLSRLLGGAEANFLRIIVAAALLTAVPLAAQGVRSHTRMNPRGTTVSLDQAVDLTLTVTPVTVRPIQVWVRTAGTVTANGRILEATVSLSDAPFMKVGQRVRAFPVDSRSSM